MADGEIDPDVPHIARVYDYWLGGQDNLPADQALAERMTSIDPGLPNRARLNRRFVLAAARRAAGEGIGRYLDLGCGMPPRGQPAVHDAARQIRPGALVAYVDNDPLAVSHTQQLAEDLDGITVTEADITRPDRVLADENVAAVLGDGKPVCVILGAVVHMMSAEAVREMTAGYLSRVPAGSWLVMSCVHYASRGLLARVTLGYTAGSFTDHSMNDFAGFFHGLTILQPGLREARRWLAGISEPPGSTEQAYILAGAGVKP